MGGQGSSWASSLDVAHDARDVEDVHGEDDEQREQREVLEVHGRRERVRGQRRELGADARDSASCIALKVASASTSKDSAAATQLSASKPWRMQYSIMSSRSWKDTDSAERRTRDRSGCSLRGGAPSGTMNATANWAEAVARKARAIGRMVDLIAGEC